MSIHWAFILTLKLHLAGLTNKMKKYMSDQFPAPTTLLISVQINIVPYLKYFRYETSIKDWMK